MRLLPVELADVGDPAGESDGGSPLAPPSPAAPSNAAGTGSGTGALRTYSNHPPARPDDTHAARIAASPTRGFWRTSREGVVGWRTPSSWTVATPTVRRKRESHLVRESERRKKRTEKRAAVRSLSW